MTMLRQTLINIATHEVGTTEDPPNSNMQKYGLWFGFNGQEWCGIFCSWVYAMANIPLDPVGWPKGFASVPMAFQHWKDRITQDPLPADLIIYDWQKGHAPEGDWSADHVGMFVEWIDRNAGTFYSIEGNTSAGNNSNGGQVQKRIRNMATVQAFINPKSLGPDSPDSTLTTNT